MPVVTPEDKAFIVSQLLRRQNCSSNSEEVPEGSQENVQPQDDRLWFKRVGEECVNKQLYKVLNNAGIEVHESGGRPFDVEGGYQGIVIFMPNELIKDRLKKSVKRSLTSFEKSPIMKAKLCKML
jgi:hypothetical protein